MKNLTHSKSFNKPTPQRIRAKHSAIFEKHKHMREDGFYDFLFFSDPAKTNASTIISEIECGDEIGKNNIEKTLSDQGIKYSTVKVGGLYRIWVTW